MKFQPKSEKEIAEMNLLPQGEYAFEVMEAEEKTSKKGAQMIVLTLKIFDQSLNPIARINDYLLESMPHKLRHAAYGCGVGSNYDQGSLEAEDFRGRNGTVKLGVQQDKNGVYPDRNSVLDYLAPKEGASQRPPFQPTQTKVGNFSQFSDEDIPF